MLFVNNLSIYCKLKFESRGKYTPEEVMIDGNKLI
jgi:hypothetical protein